MTLLYYKGFAMLAVDVAYSQTYALKAALFTNKFN